MDAMTAGYQICSRCVSDTTVPDIVFDDSGICNYCHIHDSLERNFPLSRDKTQNIDHQIRRIKECGRNRDYDCIVGISGGTDSTFCLYMAKEMGLRPLAVHFDNGWNSRTSVKNMQNSVQKLGVDLEWIRVDSKEFTDIQRSFLMASVPDAEIPTDLAIHAVLHRVAAEKNIKWIINGMNFRTEGIQPLKWSYMDAKYVKSVHKMFGSIPHSTYPTLTITDLIKFTLVKGVKTLPLLAYMDYSKEETKEILQRGLDWTDYGGHHFESLYTRFVITDILWGKFGIDKRKIQLSASVRSGKMQRKEALDILRTPPEKDPHITKVVLDKLGLSEEAFGEILFLNPKTFIDYSTNYPIIRAMKLPIRCACALNVIPKIFYAKYFGESV